MLRRQLLKQAAAVKDMMAVSERLSDVRGQIEQQQAEFNALSRQIETVAIAISLRTESEAQVFGLNWRPGYQFKLALHDGLESIATYATTMTTILFYLPATLLWRRLDRVNLYLPRPQADCSRGWRPRHRVPANQVSPRSRMMRFVRESPAQRFPPRPPRLRRRAPG